MASRLKRVGDFSTHAENDAARRADGGARPATSLATRLNTMMQERAARSADGISLAAATGIMNPIGAAPNVLLPIALAAMAIWIVCADRLGRAYAARPSRPVAVPAHTGGDLAPKVGS